MADCGLESGVPNVSHSPVMTELRPMDPPISQDVSDISTSNCVHINSTDGSHTKQSSVPNGCVRHIGNDNGLITAKTITNVSPPAKANDIDHSPANEKSDPDRISKIDDTSKSKETNSESEDISVKETVESTDNVEDSLSDTLAKANLAECDTASTKEVQRELHYVVYESEHQMPDIMRLITKDLSEPYSIYTYRYFIHNWPKLCFLVSVQCSEFFLSYSSMVLDPLPFGSASST